jgi:aspartate/methionine/tyrosine aminotransferase
VKIKPFHLERYFAQHEFSARYLLSSSDCDGFSLKEILTLANPKEQEQWNALQLGYTESSGLPELREEIAELYKGISPDEVFVLSPGEANFIAMNVLLQSGDHVICMAPAYQSLYEVARSLGCDLSFWTPAPNEATWYYDPQDLEKLITDRTKLIILNFPHNPTGYIPSLEDYHKIISIARARGIFIFADEMYHLLEHDQHDTLPPICEVYERSISLWGMAKTFALAGLRLGWVVCKDVSVMEEMKRFKDYLTICNPSTSEVLALIALRNKRTLIDHNLKKITDNLQLFTAFCEQHPQHFQFAPTRAGSTAFVKWLGKETSLAFSDQLVKATGIMTLPAEMFDFGSSHFRIGFGRKNMHEPLEILGRYLREHY